MKLRCEVACKRSSLSKNRTAFRNFERIKASNQVRFPFGRNIFLNWDVFGGFFNQFLFNCRGNNREIFECDFPVIICYENFELDEK